MRDTAVLLRWDSRLSLRQQKGKERGVNIDTVITVIEKERR
jgi:hypothetical protein